MDTVRMLEILDSLPSSPTSELLTAFVLGLSELESRLDVLENSEGRS